MGFINHDLERENQRKRLKAKVKNELNVISLEERRKEIKKRGDDIAENIYKSLVRQERKGGVIIRSN